MSDYLKVALQDGSYYVPDDRVDEARRAFSIDMAVCASKTVKQIIPLAEAINEFLQGEGMVVTLKLDPVQAVHDGNDNA